MREITFGTFRKEGVVTKVGQREYILSNYIRFANQLGIQNEIGFANEL